jgi:hypothetical protein
MSSPVDASGPDIGPVTAIRTTRAAVADGAIASAPLAADAMIEAASSAWRRIGRPYTNEWRGNRRSEGSPVVDRARPRNLGR